MSGVSAEPGVAILKSLGTTFQNVLLHRYLLSSSI